MKKVKREKTDNKESAKKSKCYEKPKISSQKVPLGGLHTVVCDGTSMAGTKVDTVSGCNAGRLLS